MGMRQSIKLVISILICLAAGFLGSFFTTPAISGWYREIQRPPFNPPDWIFAPVWTILFVLMGISLFLIIKDWSGDKKFKTALSLFIAQFILNIAWSAIFFGAGNFGLAFIEIIILLISIILTALQFLKINRPAAWLLLPYIIWVSFASFLNFSIWLLNR